MRIQLCGELVVEAEGQRIDDRLRGRQGKLLFAFLVLSRGGWIARDTVLEAVWPGGSRSRAADLSTLLSRLRSALPPESIAGRDQLRLELPAATWVDYEVAHEAAARAESEMARGRWREAWGPAHAALSICSRELLPGLDADWIDVRRRELADLQLDVLESVAQVGLRLEGSELAAAERAARRLIELSPLRESGHVILMEVQGARGNRAEALRTYELLRTRLREELGASPGAAAREAHDRLLGAEDSARPRPPAAVRTADPRAPVPPVLATPARVRFVGRDRDLARLGLMLERAEELRCQLAVLAGEPGIGKTRLLAQFAIRGRDAGATVLYGRADENGVIPYGPFVDAFRGFAAADPGTAGGDRVLGLLTEHDLDGRGSGEGPDVARLRFFDAVSDLLGRTAGDAPLLLALDDLHWADESTLLLLEHLMRDQSRSGLLVAASYRDTEAARSDLAGTIATLERELPVERIRVRPLAGADIAQIASEAAGDALSPEALRAIDAEAEGNPFFAQELASHLADEEQVTSRLPDSVSAVVERRLSRLAPHAQELLGRAAVIGREFDLDLVEQLLERPDDVMAGIEEALEAGLVAEVPDRSDRFSFSHALVRSVLYEGMSTPRRRRLHERIADLLEERQALKPEPEPGSTAEIAGHRLAALPRGDIGRAVESAGEAAREGIALLAYEEAIEHCKRGLAAIDRYMPDPGTHRLGLLVLLGDAERLAGRMVEARTTAGEAIEEARARRDPEALARAVLAHGGAGFESAFVDETMVALLEEALDAVGPADSILRLRLLSRLAKALHYAGEEGDRAKRSRLGAEAMKMAQRLEEPRAELIALEGSHFALCEPGNLDQRLAAARRIIRLATELDDSEFGLLGRYFLIADLVEVGDLESADDAIAEYGERAASSALHRWYHARFLGMRALLAGELDEAERRAQEAFELGSAVEPKTATMHFGTQLWMLQRERGGLAGLEEPVRGFVAEYPAVPAWRLGLAWVLLDQGRQEEAGEVFAEFTEARFRNIPEDAIWTLTIALAAELAVRGLAGEAELKDLVRLIEPYASRNAVSGEAIVSGGPMFLPLGMVELELGRREEAERHLGEAASAADAMGAAPFARRARALLAKARSPIS